MIRPIGLAVACLVLGISGAQAARVDSRKLSCNTAQLLVLERGSVVLATSTFLFYRYVADRSQCDRTQIIRAATAPTVDNPRCAVGFRCAPAPSSEDR